MYVIWKKFPDAPLSYNIVIGIGRQESTRVAEIYTLIN